MQKMRSRVLTVAAILVAQLPAFAQLEVLSNRAQQNAIGKIDAEIKENATTPMAAHLERAKKAGTDAAVLASRIAADFPKAKEKFVHYAVPPMSNIQRLPDVYPTDGLADKAVQIIAAKDEYEPGSFLVYPFEDLGKVTFTLTPFKTKDGKTFPADKLDLKVIKVWYQNKNGWYSYFGDTGFKLCPELLLNDEDLIRVDDEKKANYARLTNKDGSVTERWLNPPREMNERYYDYHRKTYDFMPMREGFQDAKTLQPVLLEEGAFRNFFLTAHVTKDIAEGLYKGAVKLTDKNGKELGSIPVHLRVLPFELPAPKSYVNPERDYMTTSYSYISLPMIMEENGGNLELAKKQLVAVLRDQAEHNQMFHWMHGKLAEVKFTIQAMKEAGMRTDVLFGAPRVFFGPTEEVETTAKLLAKWYDENAGHHNVYLRFGDEPSAGWLVRARPVFEAYQKQGFKFLIAGNDVVFHKTGYLYDWHNAGHDPTDSTATRLWNQLGRTQVAWYAHMHIGPENPAYNRMQYGMAPYLAGYSATCNYAHHFGPYNDDSRTYRPMVFAYGVYDGVIDTIQWEGYREGVDDIRYATLMTSLARKAGQSKDVKIRYAGMKALQYLASFPYDKGGDLNACRLEMVRHILKLRDLLAIR